MIARLLKDKGISEFLSAAKTLKSEFNDVDFLLLGHEDKSKNAVPIIEITKLDREGVISYHGFVDDVRDFLVIVLYSCFRLIMRACLVLS